MARTMCMACEKRPARRLETKRTHYANVPRYGVFCSRGCAADWALMTAHTNSDIGCCEVCKKWDGNALDFTEDDQGRMVCFDCGGPGAGGEETT